MKKSFIHDDFMLGNSFAQELYHEHASQLPIIDYHNHLPPEQLAHDTVFDSITKLWIEGDHYKWRAMRTLGVAEDYITGRAEDKEKFRKWAYTIPYTMGNPLYHWSHLELKRYFDFDDLFSAKNADSLFEQLNDKVTTSDYSARRLIEKMNVEVVCTTDDPIDSLEHHISIVKNGFKIKVCPAFRPDKVLMMEGSGYNAYLDALAAAADMDIVTYDHLIAALRKRMEFFDANGCKLSDHGLPHLYAEPYTLSEVKSIFGKRRSGTTPTTKEVLQFKSAVLATLGEYYHELGWVQQYHLGPLRNTNSRMFETLGPDTGWDSIGDYPQAVALYKFLDGLDKKNRLAKTILYNLNPRDNAVFATMIGNFNDGSIRGKVQWGSGWWFLDQKDGMEAQLKTLSNMGLLSCFVGMLTDSRSFMSFPRHEYFRRILCNLLGGQIQRGELPNDTAWIGKLVQDICYNNSKAYFKL